MKKPTIRIIPLYPFLSMMKPKKIPTKIKTTKGKAMIVPASYISRLNLV